MLHCVSSVNERMFSFNVAFDSCIINVMLCTLNEGILTCVQFIYALVYSCYACFFENLGFMSVEKLCLTVTIKQVH